ncbi:unnamed protein product [Gordionus sp. m RMFG-2023]|uniref:uncharacterized protein LOC135928231 n=1 Tax=Gordionus sp. m RMFG-2023 TaxID=3053472 RepID=UPI0030E1E73B
MKDTFEEGVDEERHLLNEKCAKFSFPVNILISTTGKECLTKNRSANLALIPAKNKLKMSYRKDPYYGMDNNAGNDGPLNPFFFYKCFLDQISKSSLISDTVFAIEINKEDGVDDDDEMIRQDRYFGSYDPSRYPLTTGSHCGNAGCVLPTPAIKDVFVLRNDDASKIINLLRKSKDISNFHYFRKIIDDNSSECRRIPSSRTFTHLCNEYYHKNGANMLEKSPLTLDDNRFNSISTTSTHINLEPFKLNDIFDHKEDTREMVKHKDNGTANLLIDIESGYHSNGGGINPYLECDNLSSSSDNKAKNGGCADASNCIGDNLTLDRRHKSSEAIVQAGYFDNSTIANSRRLDEYPRINDDSNHVTNGIADSIENTNHQTPNIDRTEIRDLLNTKFYKLQEEGKQLNDGFCLNCIDKRVRGLNNNENILLRREAIWKEKTDYWLKFSHHNIEPYSSNSVNLESSNSHLTVGNHLSKREYEHDSYKSAEINSIANHQIIHFDHSCQQTANKESVNNTPDLAAQFDDKPSRNSRILSEKGIGKSGKVRDQSIPVKLEVDPKNVVQNKTACARISNDEIRINALSDSNGSSLNSNDSDIYVKMGSITCKSLTNNISYRSLDTTTDDILMSLAETTKELEENIQSLENMSKNIGHCKIKIDPINNKVENIKCAKIPYSHSKTGENKLKICDYNDVNCDCSKMWQNLPLRPFLPLNFPHKNIPPRGPFDPQCDEDEYLRKLEKKHKLLTQKCEGELNRPVISKTNKKSPKVKSDKSRKRLGSKEEKFTYRSFEACDYGDDDVFDTKENTDCDKNKIPDFETFASRYKDSPLSANGSSTKKKKRSSISLPTTKSDFYNNNPSNDFVGPGLMGQNVTPNVVSPIKRLLKRNFVSFMGSWFNNNSNNHGDKEGPPSNPERAKVDHTTDIRNNSPYNNHEKHIKPPSDGYLGKNDQGDDVTKIPTSCSDDSVSRKGSFYNSMPRKKNYILIKPKYRLESLNETPCKTASRDIARNTVTRQFKDDVDFVRETRKVFDNQSANIDNLFLSHYIKDESSLFGTMTKRKPYYCVDDYYHKF